MTEELIVNAIAFVAGWILKEKLKHRASAPARRARSIPKRAKIEPISPALC